MSVPQYTASVLPDVTNYVVSYATGNDGCISSISAFFQPSGKSVTGYQVTGSVNQNAGFLFQRGNVSQGIQVNIIFYSTTVPTGTSEMLLTFATTKGNNYQLALINTLPINNNYALVVVVQLTFTSQPSEYINVTNLLNVVTSFASNQCQTPSQAQVTYQGEGFSVLFQSQNLTNNVFNMVFIAINNSSLQSLISIVVLLNNTSVATALISVPPSEYAYFLFSLVAELEGG
jgi:hypothetical protein